MKYLFSIFILITLLGCTSKTVSVEVKPYKSLSFLDLWTVLKSDPYSKLPQTKVSYYKLSSSKENLILKNAIRTLNNHADILEPFEKLAHPNGICFAGIWKIDTPNIYSGYFKNSSKALIVARASTALSNTTNDSTRAFGFAGKIFPTTNPNKISKQSSANFFLIDDLGGTDAKYYRDVSLTNEPEISITYEVIKNMFYAIKLSSTFKKADANPSIRQLYEISNLGTDKNIITPKWMKIKISKAKNIKEKDFRNELKIKKGKILVFDIFVANKIIASKKQWKRIGNMTFNTSVISKSCDQRLHFHHAKWRDDLDYGLE